MKKYNILIVGGGSTWTPGIIKALTKNIHIFNLKKVILYDINEQRQSIIGGACKILFEEETNDVEFIYTSNKEVAYENVDFVFCQMRTGGYKMREIDEKIPLKYGVLGQETCGPGGFSYGLRSIGDMIEMVNDVRKNNKNAWILNYTNPAAIVALALKKEFSNDTKILNICDQPVNLLRSYGRLIEKDYNTFEPRYFGLNHFGWFTNIYDELGIDLVPEIKKKIIDGGFKPVDAEQRDKSWLETYSMVENMLNDFDDYLPNTYLQYYLYPKYKTSKANQNYTRANEVINGREKKVFAECQNIIDLKTAKQSHLVHNDAHGDMIVEVAASIANNSKKTFILIVQNNGIISNLEEEVMVEVACSLGINGPIPYNFGKIPRFYKGLIENQYASELLLVEAYFENSYKKALQAFTLSRTINDAFNAREILDALIEVNKGYWPKLK